MKASDSTLRMEDMMDDQTLPRLLTAQEVEDMTGIPRWRLYERVREGDLPAVHVGRAVRFSAPALRAWIEAGGTRDEEDKS